MSNMNPEQIKNKILSHFESLTEFALKHKLNYQRLSNTIHGRGCATDVIKALYDEFKIHPSQLPLPPKSMTRIEKLYYK